MNTIPSEFIEYLQRQELMENRVIRYSANQLSNEPFTARAIVETYSSLSFTAEEMHRCMHGMVIAKKAEWIYQERSISAFSNQLRAVPMMPPINTPFRLI